MKYTITNNGSDSVSIRVSVPPSLVPAFVQFIENQQSSVRNKTLSVNGSKSNHDENYFIKLTEYAVRFYSDCFATGNSVNASISYALKKMKGANYHNISYDRLKSILTSQGCFRSDYSPLAGK